MKLSNFKVGWIDHMLAAIAAALTSYSSLASIGRHEIGLIFAMASLVLGLVGGILRSALSADFVQKRGAIFYVATGLLVLTLQVPLNRLLPENGFPPQILFAGTFTWIIVFTLLFTWQDTTLCFQAVPSIAIFGLVGAFDTFKAAPWFFFVFLLCTTALFFRAHTRTMFRSAAEALGSMASEEGDRDVAEQVIRSGAWQWMAGPWWALGSALVIVVFSFFGAPVIQQSVRTVRGNGVQLVPPTLPSPSSNTNPQNFNSREALRVGNGPANSYKIDVLKVRTPSKSAYLRGETYAVYTGRGWASNPRVGRLASARSLVDPELVIPEGEVVGVSLRYLSGAHTRIYTPGEFVREFQPQLRVSSFPDGTAGSSFITAGTDTQFFVRVATASPVNRTATIPPFPERAEAWRTTGPITDRLAKFAAEAVAGGRTDLQKLRSLERMIGNQCNYNLNAPEIDRDKNVADEFLFEVKEGYCDLFATAFTVAARSQGYYARVCTGFLIQPQVPDADGFMTIQDADYHMWSEVYFEGVGWIPFDSTRYSRNVSEVDQEAAAQARQRWVIAASLLSVVAVAWTAGRSWLARLRADRINRKPTNKLAGERIAQQYFRWTSRVTGKPRRLAETPSEYLIRIADAIPSPTAHSEFLAKIESSMYGQSATHDQDLAMELKKLQKDGLTKNHEN